MSGSLGLGLGLSHLRKNSGVITPPPSGALLVDGNPILVDSFEIVFA